jgi:hypothetical protein
MEEENKYKKQGNKSATVIVMSIVIVLLILVGVMGWHFYNKNKNLESEQSVHTSSTHVTTEKQVKNTNTNITGTIYDKFDEIFGIQNEIVTKNIKYKNTAVKVEAIFDDWLKEVKFNDKVIDLNSGYGSLEIQALNDVIVLSTGWTAPGGELIVFDINGKRLLTVTNFDSNLSGMKYNRDFTIKDDSIIIEATRENTCDAGVMLINNKYIDLNSDEGKTLDGSEIVSAKYEIKYLGNYKFADPVRTETIKTVADIRNREVDTLMQSYIGTWSDDVNAPDILTISPINDNSFKLELDLYRLFDLYATVKIENNKLENNKIEFSGNSSIGVNMSGSLEFSNNSIIVTIDKSGSDIGAETRVFTIKVK